MSTYNGILIRDRSETKKQKMLVNHELLLVIDKCLKGDVAHNLVACALRSNQRFPDCAKSSLVYWGSPRIFYLIRNDPKEIRCVLLIRIHLDLGRIYIGEMVIDSLLRQPHIFQKSSPLEYRSLMDNRRMEIGLKNGYSVRKSYP